MCLSLTVIDELVFEDEEEQLMVGCFDDGCKDVVVESRRRGQPSGFVEEQDGRAKQEAASHVIIMVPSHVDGQEQINTSSSCVTRESAPLLIATSFNLLKAMICGLGTCLVVSQSNCQDTSPFQYVHLLGSTAKFHGIDMITTFMLQSDVGEKDVVDESEKNPTWRHALVVGEAR
jgi:hypothetical protein